ncbi:MAG: hypothetical protein GWO20_11880 [Candidatus Korarchaeota archaeon]|nr:hypothetical protein [Candidatus Korarchaeota archaeon]NIU84131.1 hypothetical protein [Candidatus Thorarchaeota archaeon]NIW14276.1 hypothetical protein [Candidatus Thorarchaeota archaeon]NIW52373.1 hypothetical protein [Candidatus Korarchaeota archaeon]
MEGPKQELPDILFLVLHEGGTLIYAYPPIGKQGHSLASLVSAISALGEQLLGKTEEVSHTSVGKYTVSFLQQGEVIYSLFISKKCEGDFRGLLLTLSDLVRSDFPAQISDGILEMEGGTEDLTRNIEGTIKTYRRLLK